MYFCVYLPSQVPYDQALAAVAGNRTAAVRETEIRVLTADEVRAQEAALVKAEGGGQAVAIPGASWGLYVHTLT